MLLKKFSSSLNCALLAALALSACAAADNVPIAANHMRWEGHEAVLDHALAWQQEKDGHWVTFVLLTDRPISADLVARTDDPGELAEKAGAQALMFPVMSGGLPLSNAGIDVWFHDGDELRTSALNGAGGIYIESLTADHIKGRTISGWAKEADAFQVNFDAPIMHGDAARMAAEGEVLGKEGQPGKDMLAALAAERTKDTATLKKYLTPEMAANLDDASKRDGMLDMMQRMVPDHPRIVSGLRNGDKASVYWVKNWNATDARNMCCTESMVLIEGTWRTSLSSCGAE